MTESMLTAQLVTDYKRNIHTVFIMDMQLSVSNYTM